MSASYMQQRIGTVELALKEAGPVQALNAVIDVLKEMARTLEALENPASGGALPAQSEKQ